MPEAALCNIALDRLEDQPLNRSAGMVSQLRIIRCHA